MKIISAEKWSLGVQNGEEAFLPGRLEGSEKSVVGEPVDRLCVLPGVEVPASLARCLLPAAYVNA